MLITIGQNIQSLTAQRGLERATQSLSRVYERLSSGQRVNRASDDAAGIAIASQLSSSSRVFTQGIRNINDGISLLNVAEGALSQLTNITIRIKELAEQSANGTYSQQQRIALHTESQALTKEYNRIIQSTTFNGVQVLDGSEDTVRLQHGYGSASSTAINSTEKLGTAAGTGAFTLTSSAQSGAPARANGIADFNGDGFLDVLAEGNPAQAHLKINYGNGTGAIAAGVNVTTSGDNADFGLTSGDYDGDGDVDIVSVDTSNILELHRNSGTGSFTSAQTFTLTGTFRSLDSADMNLDGIQDMAALTSAGTRIFLGRSDGTFADLGNTIGAIGSSIHMSIDDFNGDYRPDIVVSSGGTAHFHAGAGNGTFGTAVTTAIVQGVYLESGDFNDDDIADLVHVGATFTYLSLGSKTGAFQNTAAISGGNTYANVADFNGDGKLDLVASSSTTTTYFQGRGNGALATGVSIPSPVQNFATVSGDMNGDGITDLITGDGGASTVSVYLGNVDGTGRRRTSAPDIDLRTNTTARRALDTTSRMLDSLAIQLGSIGAAQSRLEVVTRSLQSTSLNYESAEGRIIDADIASEAAELTRQKILQQTASSILAQANSQPGIALSLLRPGG